jgi:hypothetical protein
MLLSVRKAYNGLKGIRSEGLYDMSHRRLYENTVLRARFVEPRAEYVIILALKSRLINRGRTLGIKLHHKERVGCNAAPLLLYNIKGYLLDVFYVKGHYRQS